MAKCCWLFVHQIIPHTAEQAVKEPLRKHAPFDSLLAHLPTDIRHSVTYKFIGKEVSSSHNSTLNSIHQSHCILLIKSYTSAQLEWNWWIYTFFLTLNNGCEAKLFRIIWIVHIQMYILKRKGGKWFFRKKNNHKTTKLSCRWNTSHQDNDVHYPNDDLQQLWNKINIFLLEF